MEPASAAAATLRYLSADDLRLTASLLLNAYRDDPFFRAVLPSQDYEQRLRAAIREELQEMWQRQQRFLGLEVEGTLVAVASLLDQHYPLGQSRFWNWRLKMALGTGWSGARQWMAREEDVMDSLGAGPSWLIQFIAVAPAYQRRGYGAQLLAALTRWQREEQVPALAAMVYQKALVPMFEQQGFQFLANLKVGRVEGDLYRLSLAEASIS
ncbi:GNAT family N-acetyltransferase [Ferrimonas marina]|uniref:Acetyltransferase (GNAT) family protein n=1 Tax=Ferrimonas marina TaxID=299255 RepID=A0A1M5YG95_9GAMM|nr:GNAT family N-acetyltransferase [Ferrimonas marina]SHI10914.1 Acetyltransferase (GNAT) family protein [Ferrimonas marina]